MLSWLTAAPNLEKVARALVLDYFSSYRQNHSPAHDGPITMAATDSQNRRNPSI